MSFSERLDQKATPRGTRREIDDNVLGSASTDSDQPTMSPERWREVQWLFDAVLSRPPEQRARFLADATAEDPALEREVESLVRSLEAASRFIDQPAVDLHVSEEPDAIAPGTRIGAYRVVRLLGTGGVGRVVLAARADRSFERRVAIKVLKRGMDTDELVRRFKSERQILAQLDHPNIAKLLDGGATGDGRPYLVMEHVDGIAIDRWCAERGIGVRARLELFLAVARAVQLAHRNLIVHRDLKPGNILVDHDGVPKLLDFGIAKLLAPDSVPSTVLPTDPGWRAMTPEYASPEQVRGDAVTTATDVYALGVVLFELLAGRRPYDLADRSPGAIERAVCDTEAPRVSRTLARAAASGSTVYGPDADPRQLERALAGDLDSIVATALEKDPGHRYASVDRLVDDLERHLDGRPVSARPDTFWYRTSKLVRRHRLAFALAAGACAVLVAFLATLLVQRSQILRQRDRAELVSSFLTDLFEVSQPSRERGETVTARELLERGARDIDARLRDRPVLRGELLGTMGETFTKLGLLREAEGLLERSHRLVERHDASDGLAAATAQKRLADLRLALDDYAAAEGLARQALVLHENRLGAGHPATIESRLTLARVHHAAGALDDADTLFRQADDGARAGGHDELLVHVAFERGMLARYRDDGSAERLLRQAATRAEAFWGADHPQLALILAQLAEVTKARDQAAAEALLDRALAIQRKVYRGPHPDLASTRNNRAVLDLELGRLDAAEAGFREALEIQRASQPGASALAAMVTNNLAQVARARGELETAAEQLRASLDMHRDIFGPEHEETANALNNLTVALTDLGRFDEAEVLITTSLEILVATYGPRHSRVAVVYNNLGRLAQRQGDLARADEHLTRAVEMLRAVAPRDPDLPGVLQNLAGVADRRGEAERARALYAEALETLAAAGRGDGPQAAVLYNNLAVSAVLSGALEDAEQWARRGLSIHERIDDPGSPERLRLRRLLAIALDRQGRLEEAETLMSDTVADCARRWGDEAEACARHVTTLASIEAKRRQAAASVD